MHGQSVTKQTKEKTRLVNAFQRSSGGRHQGGGSLVSSFHIFNDAWSNFDAYSVKWTGASQVNPEYEVVAMEKAMRWAILSAEEATEPALTTFALPW